MRFAFAPPRSRRALALVAILLVTGGCGADQSAPASRPAVAPLRPAVQRAAAELPLREQVGQTLVLSFHGTTLPPYVRRILREDRVAGVILFGENVASPAQLRRLTRTIQSAAGGRALIAVDQEGGAIRIVRFAPSSRGQPGQATPSAAHAAARATAHALRTEGVNVNLAPVADVAAEDRSVMRGRAFPGGADHVAALVDEAVGAYRAGRVAATVKHFPGFGRAGANTDDRPVIIAVGRTALRRRDLVPFRAAIAAGAPVIMASHALYPAFGTRIASQSPELLSGVLRRELHFGGLIITDSIEADAVLRRSSVQTAAVRSIAAGADIVLMTGPASYRLLYPRLLAEARGSAGFRGRVHDAAARTLALKRLLGLRVGGG